MSNDERSAAKTYPMVGRQYYVEFPTMSFYLHFVSDQALEFIVEKSPDLPKGSAHTVNSCAMKFIWCRGRRRAETQWFILKISRSIVSTPF